MSEELKPTAYNFGDPIELIAASEDNPIKHSFFVRSGYRTGRVNTGKYIEFTDGKGYFGTTPPDNVRPRAATPPQEQTR